ncbi:hypothetical protein JOE65_001984 [Arthrobacter roseus]|nr:hypothetical protein [Arthrobacter roseus]
MALVLSRHRSTRNGHPIIAHETRWLDAEDRGNQIGNRTEERLDCTPKRTPSTRSHLRKSFLCPRVLARTRGDGSLPYYRSQAPASIAPRNPPPTARDSGCLTRLPSGCDKFKSAGRGQRPMRWGGSRVLANGAGG